MKIVFQAFIASLLIHVFYFIAMISVSFSQTMNYKPDGTAAWGEVEMLQNEVVFGKVISPLLGLFSFVLVAIICGILIVLYRRVFYKLFNKKNRI